MFVRGMHYICMPPPPNTHIHTYQPRIDRGPGRGGTVSAALALHHPLPPLARLNLPPAAVTGNRAAYHSRARDTRSMQVQHDTAWHNLCVCVFVQSFCLAAAAVDPHAPHPTPPRHTARSCCCCRSQQLPALSHLSSGSRSCSVTARVNPGRLSTILMSGSCAATAGATSVGLGGRLQRQ